MKKVETFYGKINGKTYKVIPMFEIEKAIVEAQSMILSKYKEPPTMRQLLKDRSKMTTTVEAGLGVAIPFYNIYALIRNASYERKLKVYDNIVEMYSYAYNCPLDFLEYEELTDTYNLNCDITPTGDKVMSLKEILNSKVDISNLQKNNFSKSFATYKFNTMNNVGKKYATTEEFLEIEKKVLDSYLEDAKKPEEIKETKKR